MVLLVSPSNFNVELRLLILLVVKLFASFIAAVFAASISPAKFVVPASCLMPASSKLRAKVFFLVFGSVLLLTFNADEELVTSTNPVMTFLPSSVRLLNAVSALPDES